VGAFAAMARAPHVHRFVVTTSLVDGQHYNLTVVETLPDAQELPSPLRADAVERVLFHREMLTNGEDAAIRVFTACERVVEAMNNMNLALEANDPQEVFNYLFRMEQDDVTEEGTA
jgi:CO/xanthine dehydrogenase Mo-binding subunit